MKDKSAKKLSRLYADETYLEGVNLVTGAKIDHQRVLSTQSEIKRLCINENLSKPQKFMQILSQENKLQKWSIFQNIHEYILSPQSACSIFQAIYKQYSQLQVQLLAVLGQGINKFLQMAPLYMFEKSKTYLYQVIYRTMTMLNPQLAWQWSPAFETYFTITKDSIEQCMNFINGSFSMKATPQRRQIAFIMINCLFWHSGIPSNQIKTKVIFFSMDHNPKTRQLICEIAGKILKKEPNDEELWKTVWQYSNDSEKSVMKKAISVICNIKKSSQSQNILQQLLNPKKIDLILQHFHKIIVNFKKQILLNKDLKKDITQLINLILKSQNNQNIKLLIEQFPYIFQIISQLQLYKSIQVENLSTIKKININHLLQLIKNTNQPQIRYQLKTNIFKGIKFHGYNYYDKIQLLMKCLDFNIDEDINLFINLITKMLQTSKWYCLKVMICQIKSIKMNQTIYQKISLFLLKLILNCPYFLLQLTINQIVYLLLSNKRSLDFLIMIRQKLMSSKSWSHRRNYLMLYFKIKCQSSFQFQKIIPVYIYKNVPNQKCVPIKLQFIRTIINSYCYIDPNSNEKILIRDAVMKLTEDKDKFVSNEAIKAQQLLDSLDIDGKNNQIAYNRNNENIKGEQQIKQFQADSKQLIKTQKDIRRSLKKRTDIRTNVNLIKQSSKIELSYNKIKVVQEKKNIMFRCNSQRVKGSPISNKNKI